ncbi:MAG: hypothetical protein [Microviridae sp.]|nr:MAG: hypothetical protein [Microviridae sp.]
MKEETNTTFEFTDTELLEKARNSKSTLKEELPIQDTPFTAIKEDGGWFAAMGPNKLTEEFETTEELLAWIDVNHWEFLIRVVLMVVQTLDMQKMKGMKEYMDKKNAESQGIEEGFNNVKTN